MAPLIRITGRAHRGPAVAAAVLFVALALPALAWSQLPLPVADPTTPAKRDAEPVVLTGKDFLDWSARANATVKLPLTDLHRVQRGPERRRSRLLCAQPLRAARGRHRQAPSARARRRTGCSATAGTRRQARWRQIPFQVDEQFTRYLDNSASGFAVYSGEDQHTTYAFDREGWRFTQSDPRQPVPGPTDRRRADDADPVKGLDDDDELAFMASDAGPQAPASAPLPRGVEAAHRGDRARPADRASAEATPT